MRARYPTQAIVICVALGIALGMVAWALFIHDNDGGGAPSPTPPQQAPSR